MKYAKLLGGMALSAALVLPTVQSAAAAEVNRNTEAKRAGVVMGSFITGAVAGGPVGALAGMFAGAWLGDKVETADRVETVEAKLTQASQQVDDLSLQLTEAQKLSRKYAQVALDQLQLELLFKTGDGQLTRSGQRRLVTLADFLVKNPELNIRLDGYADPRGGADYNLALSDARVKSVEQLLVEKGVEPTRIEATAHGASESSAVSGDYDGYALERVVKIQLIRGDSPDAVAQVTINQ